MSKIIDLKTYIISSLEEYSISSYINFDSLYLECDKSNIHEILKFLNNDKKYHFSQLVDITVVDYINEKKRFEIVYFILSHKSNIRLILKTYISENESISSICDLYESANWHERECYDLFGIIFDNHPDLRRILTDYNFVGHPLRKDFPLTGHNEVRYDDLQKKVIYEPVNLQQEYRNFDFSSPWEGYSRDLLNKENNSDKDNE